MAFHSLHHSLSTYAICTIKNLPDIRALQDKVQGNFLPLACNISFISFSHPYQLLICLFCFVLHLPCWHLFCCVVCCWVFLIRFSGCSTSVQFVYLLFSLFAHFPCLLIWIRKFLLSVFSHLNGCILLTCKRHCNLFCFQHCTNLYTYLQSFSTFFTFAF